MTPIEETTDQKPFRSRFAPWLRVVSCLIVTTFLVQDLASAQGGTPVWSNVKASNDSNSNKGPAGEIAIPLEAGVARKVAVNGAGDVIINIQDAHSKLGAQAAGAQLTGIEVPDSQAFFTSASSGSQT